MKKMEKIERIVLCVFIVLICLFINFTFAESGDVNDISGETIINSTSGEDTYTWDDFDRDWEGYNQELTDILGTNGDNFESKSLKGKVTYASEPYVLNDDYSSAKAQNLKVKITDKKHNGEEYDVIYYLEDDYNTRLPLYHELKVNDQVYVYANFENGVFTGPAYVQYYDKTPWIIVLCVVFSLSVIFIGGIKGIKALIGLLITIFLIFAMLIPAILNGYNPVLITVLLSIIVIFLTFIIVSGFNKKTLCAIIGTSAGIITAVIIGVIFSNLMQLTGINEHARMISASIPEDKPMVSFTGIMLSGIIISALGACMDVGMSISSALFELKQKKPSLNARELIKSGFNIGKDVMGTMVNTLILAYVGSSLLCLLLYSVNYMDLGTVLNQEDIAVEVLKSISGSIGLIYTIPLTAIISGILLGKKPQKEENIEIPVNEFKG